MPIQAVEPRRLYRQIAAQLRDLIVAGEYAPGTRLPPERDLAKQLNVSRPSVREALIALEVEGLVEIRMGSGIYACSQPASPANTEAEFGPLEIFRARRVVEGEIAALAAQAANAGDIDSIQQALAQMEAEWRTGGSPQPADMLFHERIAEATGNGVLVATVRQLIDARKGPLFSKFSNYFDTPDTWRIVINEHRAILDAIAAHDPESARAAMKKHMDMAHRRFSASWPQTSAQTASRSKSSASTTSQRRRS